QAPDWAVGTSDLPLPVAAGPTAHPPQAGGSRQNSIPLPHHPVWSVMLPVCIAGLDLRVTIHSLIGRPGAARLLVHHRVRRHLVTGDPKEVPVNGENIIIPPHHPPVAKPAPVVNPVPHDGVRR